MTMSVLVTGGAGFIGSHACVILLEAGYRVTVVDNLSNSKEESLRRIEKITGKPLRFYRADIRDKYALNDILRRESIAAVMHFAGLKAVGESCAKPLDYYQNNVCGTMVLLEAMRESGVNKLVFSSSATVYGEPRSVPIDETFPLSATNPYGRTKLMIEDILRDLAAADYYKPSVAPWKIALLRYFNPIGAHGSGAIGEDPNGIPNNLAPFVAQVAIGKLTEVTVFGNDYPTPDGTGVRDYIHVVDLVRGHLNALQVLDGDVFRGGGCEAYNLGTGQGYSVLDVIAAFRRVTGKAIPYRIAGRRPGDVVQCYANPEKARKRLHWQAEKSLDDMVADAWRWQVNNPQGYE
jgi:UDP-glucose 4-epimerase